MKTGDGCETGRDLAPPRIVQVGHGGGERHSVFGGEAVLMSMDGHDADVEPNGHPARPTPAAQAASIAPSCECVPAMLLWARIILTEVSKDMRAGSSG
jgi:hypothetical protein